MKASGVKRKLECRKPHFETGRGAFGRLFTEIFVLALSEDRIAPKEEGQALIDAVAQHARIFEALSFIAFAVLLVTITGLWLGTFKYIASTAEKQREPALPTTVGN